MHRAPEYRNELARKAPQFRPVGVEQHRAAFGSQVQSLRRIARADHIARHLNYSPSHFSAVFSKRTGHTPINYFNQLKIQQACAYLDFTDMKVTQICPRLGIDDPYYFSRLFHKHMGMSPSDYKKCKKG